MNKPNFKISTLTQSLALAGLVALSPVWVTAQESSGSSDNTQSSMSNQDSVSKMSQDPASTLIRTIDEAYSAIRDVRAARLAIFNGNTELASQFVDDAAQNLQKAEEMMSEFAIPEGTSSSGQEQASAQQQGSEQQTGEEQQQASAEQQQDSSQQSSGDSGETKTLIPFDMSIVVAEGYVATAEKDAAVAEANKSLAQGDQQGAIQTLRLADVDVAVAAAVIPAESSVSHVQKAQDLMGQEQYYEANVALKAIEDSVTIQTFAIDALPAQGSGGASGSQSSTDGSSSDEG